MKFYLCQEFRYNDELSLYFYIPAKSKKDLFRKIDILRKQEGTNQIFYCSDSCPIDDEDFTDDDIPAIWGFYWD